MIEILTAILVLVTGFYAYVTFKILKANEGVLSEMQAQQDALYRPYVSISPVLHIDNSCISLKIKNTGKTAAHNLKLSVDKDFYQFGNKDDKDNLRNLSAFTEIIDSFVPESEMLFYLAQGFKIFGNNADEKITPSIFTITARYSYGEKTVVEKTKIDLRPYLNSAIPQDPIVDNLKDIKKSMDKQVKVIASINNN